MMCLKPLIEGMTKTYEWINQLYQILRIPVAV